MIKNKVMQLVVEDGSPETARMTIYGDISSRDWVLMLTGETDGLTTRALDVAQALASLPEETRAVEVHINSYGGEVAEGAAIYNALRQSGLEVTTVCDGFACSIASVIFMAGSRRVMEPASMLMLHNPLLTGVDGNARQLRKAADDLDAIAGVSKAAYLDGTALDAETLDAVMDAETWVTPSQAVEWGLATEVAERPGAAGPVQVAEGLMARLAESPAQSAPDGGGLGDEPARIEMRLNDLLVQVLSDAVAAEPEPVQAAPAEPEQEALRGFRRYARLLQNA